MVEKGPGQIPNKEVSGKPTKEVTRSFVRAASEAGVLDKLNYNWRIILEQYVADDTTTFKSLRELAGGVSLGRVSQIYYRALWRTWEKSPADIRKRFPEEALALETQKRQGIPWYEKMKMLEEKLKANPDDQTSRRRLTKILERRYDRSIRLALVQQEPVIRRIEKENAIGIARRMQSIGLEGANELFKKASNL